LILAGDIGGTKCNLALLDRHEDGFQVRFKQHFPTHEYSRFEDMIDAFLGVARQASAASAQEPMLAAGFGVAGPVMGRRVQMTNVKWAVDGDSLERQLGTRHVVLLNDLEATGYSLAWLEPDQLLALNAGAPANGAAQALIAAGTGLGEAILRWNGSRYVVAPSEGGHCDFAPRNEKEIGLLRHMKKGDEPVSFEMILSGRGFGVIHDFLSPTARHPSFDQPGVDPAPEITKRGLDGSCAVCVETLDLWTSIYGAEAGNLALKALSRGGVFVAGGIAPKILPKMKDGTFLRAFSNKEKFEEMLSRVPVQIVLNEEAPMLGAAAEAALALGQATAT
jgi:glucokinase